jgi:hypothetical protein
MVDSKDTPIYRIISAAESAQGVMLTYSAREILAIPVMERFEVSVTIDWEQVQSSVHQVIAAANSGVHPGEMIDKKLNAIAIIRGFHAHFCNIPPFCVRR